MGNNLNRTANNNANNNDITPSASDTAATAATTAKNQLIMLVEAAPTSSIVSAQLTQAQH